jgi:hypothetical protein
MNLEEICNTNIQCFKCDKAYSCRYYQNPLWDWYIFNNPNEGCPAMKYPFESLYFALLEQKDKGTMKKWP